MVSIEAKGLSFSGGRVLLVAVPSPPPPVAMSEEQVIAFAQTLVGDKLSKVFGDAATALGTTDMVIVFDVMANRLRASARTDFATDLGVVLRRAGGGSSVSILDKVARPASSTTEPPAFWLVVLIPEQRLVCAAVAGQLPATS